MSSKTALITGAAKRIGKAIVLHLANQGWNIAIHYNTSADEARLFRDKLVESYPRQQFELFKADLNSTEEVETLISQVVKTMGNLDLLINNASVFKPGSFANTSTTLLDHQININFRAPFILTRDFAKQIKKGLIINFVDTRIVTNKSNFAAYSLSKKALW